MPAKKIKPFDLTKYQVVLEAQPVTLTMADGAKLELKVQELTWKQRNKHLISATRVNSAGVGVFDGPEFAVRCIIDMIVEAPWGATNEAFMTQINSELGDVLATLVPMPKQEDEELSEMTQAKK